MNSIKTYVNNHIIISKLKKEAKIFLRENPQYHLMDCQNKIAQQYGYQHWHELHEVFKSSSNEIGNIQYVSSNPVDNLPLGIDNFSNQMIYLNKYFGQLNIFKNEYSPSIISSLLENIMNINESLILYFNNGLNNIEDLENYAKKNNIKCYNLSFNELTKHKNNIYYDLSSLSSGGLADLLICQILKENYEYGESWKRRAISLITCLAPAWHYLSYTKKIILTAQFMSQQLSYDNIITLSKRVDLPRHIIDPIKKYINDLPAYDSKLPSPLEITLEMHGYVQMQFTKILGDLEHFTPYLFAHNKLNFTDLLEKQEKSLLIIDLPKDTYLTITESIITILMSLFTNALNSYHNNKVYKSEQYYLKYKIYYFFDNTINVDIDNMKNPVRLPINYIFYNSNIYGKGINIIPHINNNILIRKN